MGVQRSLVILLARLDHVTVVDTIPAICSSGSCAGFRDLSVGVGSYLGADVGVSNFLLAGNGLCGVQLASASMDLQDGVIRGHSVGANVQTPGFDLGRLAKRVLFTGNNVNSDSASLPLPPPPAQTP